jgi:hypothetical protein
VTDAQWVEKYGYNTSPACSISAGVLHSCPGAVHYRESTELLIIAARSYRQQGITDVFSLIHLPCNHVYPSTIIPQSPGNSIPQ